MSMQPQSDTSDIYRSITFTGPERAELLKHVIEPQALGPHEISGRTIVSLISPGTELAGYTGKWWWTQFPVVPGYAVVFEVTRVGDQVSDLKSGDYVFSTGPHQSVQRCRREEAILLPSGMDVWSAPFARLMSVTMTTLTTTTARPPETVLVTGLGVVGLLAAQMFSACGYDVIGCDPIVSRQEIAARHGLKQVTSSIPLSNPEVAGRVALVLECSGHEQAALDACNVVKKRGEVVLVATPWQRRTELYANDLLLAVFQRYVVLRSGWEWELPMQPADYRTNSIRGNLATAMQWIADGRVNVDGLAKLVKPAEAGEAYAQLKNSSNTYLTALFDWT